MNSNKKRSQSPFKKNRSKSSVENSKNAGKKALIVVPMSRVNAIMRSCPQLTTVKNDAVALTSHAAELFIKELIKKTYEKTEGKELSYKILSTLIEKSGNEFLQEAVPRTVTYKEYLELKKRKEAEENGDYDEEQEDEEEDEDEDDENDEENDDEEENEVNNDEEDEENNEENDEEEEEEDENDEENNNEEEYEENDDIDVDEEGEEGDDENDNYEKIEINEIYEDDE